MNPEIIIATLGLGAAIAFGILAWFFKKQATLLNEENKKLTEAKIRLEGERSAASLVEEKLNELPSSLVDKLKNVSTEINRQLLEESSRSVVTSNRDAVKAHIDTFEASIKAIKEELSRQNTEGGKKVDNLEGMVALLNQTHQTLSTKAEQLTHALTSSGSSKVQGCWGEMQLKRLLEDSGMMKHVVLSPQESIRDSENNRLIPDYVINLPEGKKMIVDAKVSLPSGLLVKTSRSEDELREARKDLCGSLISHIDGLANKNYSKAFGDWSPEFVFMYVPLPGLIDEAIEHKRDLYEYAVRKNVILAEPRTVMALLICAANIWKVSDQNKNQGKIIKLGEKLLSDLGAVRESWIKMGEGLDKAREAYEAGGKKVVGTDGRSLEGCAQQLLGLGVTPKIGKSAAGRKKKSQAGIAGQGQFLDVSAEQVSEDSEEDDQEDGDQAAAANQ